CRARGRRRAAVLPLAAQGPTAPPLGRAKRPRVRCPHCWAPDDGAGCFRHAWIELTHSYRGTPHSPIGFAEVRPNPGDNTTLIDICWRRGPLGGGRGERRGRPHRWEEPDGRV